MSYITYPRTPTRHCIGRYQIKDITLQYNTVSKVSQYTVSRSIKGVTLAVSRTSELQWHTDGRVTSMCVELEGEMNA